MPSNFSFLRGASHTEELVLAAAARGLSAIARGRGRAVRRGEGAQEDVRRGSPESHHFQGHVEGATIAVKWEGDCPPGRRWVRSGGRPRRIPRARTRRNERGPERTRGAFHAAQSRHGDGAPHARACVEFTVD
ncbi:hypothetical protein F0U63_07685 [Cystobacter fuscus]|nr:hypothetical protein F0U63_07685 [Cystobacter fuscus]